MFHTQSIFYQNVSIGNWKPEEMQSELRYSCNTSLTLVGSIIVYSSDVAGASPVGAASTLFALLV